MSCATHSSTFVQFALRHNAVVIRRAVAHALRERGSASAGIEPLERRMLLSVAAGSLDTSFGNGGYVSGYAVGVLPNNELITRDGNLVSPAGNDLGPYTGVVPQPQAHNVQ